MPRDVLLPTDGSPLSGDALELALATFPDENITLIHVDDPRNTAGDDDELRPDRVFADLLETAESTGSRSIPRSASATRAVRSSGSARTPTSTRS